MASLGVPSTASVSAIIPNGSNAYVALLTALPDADGAGLVEATGSGYARLSASAWINITVDESTLRVNDGAIEFAELTAALTGIVGWAIYDAASGGNILSFGAFLDFSDEETTKNLVAGDIPRLIDQELKIGTEIYSFPVTSQAAAAAYEWRGVCWSPELLLFCAVASTGAGSNYAMTSPDGYAWTIRANGAGAWYSVCWSSDLELFCAVGVAGAVATSPDGITWTSHTAAEAIDYSSVCWSPELTLFCAVGVGGTDNVMTSPDGTTWTARTAAFNDGYNAVCWSPELTLFCAVAVSSDNTRQAMTSPDGTTWTGRVVSATNPWTSVVWAPELSLFVAVATDGASRVMTSPTGVTWTGRTAAEANSWQSVMWAPDLALLVAVASDGTNRIMTSPTGITWTAVAAAEANSWNSITWSPGLVRWVAVSSDGTDRVMTLSGVIEGTAELDVVDESFLPRLQALLPPGVAWSRDSDTELTALTRALSYEFSRVKKRTLDFMEELDPQTTTEMIDDWERVYGLPDECDLPVTLAGRRSALHAKMLGGVSPTLSNIIAVAAAVGYTVTITEYTSADMFTCISPCNAALYSREWMYVWTVTTPSGADDEGLECALDAITPSHTLLVMNFT